jgi:hypothetical protein
VRGVSECDRDASITRRPWPTESSFAIKVNRSISKLIRLLIFCKKRDNQQYRRNGIAHKSNKFTYFSSEYMH